MLAVLPWKSLWSGKTENPPMSAHSERSQLTLAELPGRIRGLKSTVKALGRKIGYKVHETGVK